MGIRRRCIAMKAAMIAGSGGSGGYMAYIKGLLGEMSEHDVVLFCTKELEEKVKDNCKNVKIYTTPYAKERGIDIFLNKPLSKQMIDAVNEFEPDVVFFTPGWIRKGLEKYPNIMVLHNQLYVDDKTLFKTISKKTFLTMMGFRHSVRRSMKKADGVIFLSDKSKLCADKNNISYKKGCVIPFGLPSESFCAPAKRAESTGEIKLLYVSAFFEYKKHDGVFYAISNLKKKGYDLKITLIGKGPSYREEFLKNLSKELDIEENIEFTGWKNHDEVLLAIDDTDIFVYPSSIESTGLGVMEAMARGACIASSDMSCMSEVLEDAGVYFNPDDYKQIEQTLEKLINDKTLREMLSHKAFEYSKKYSWEVAAKKHYDFFESFAHQGRSYKK